MKQTPALIIAEAGVNHNGSVELGKKLIDVAADAGADIVKFQTFTAKELVARNAPKAKYQLKTTGAGESQFDMLKKLELNRHAHVKLIEHCRKRKIQFLSTPFDLPSVDLLMKEMKLSSLKIPSGEITNSLLLLKAAAYGKPLILSTGNSMLAEIESALSVLAFGYTQKGKAPTIRGFEEAYCSKAGQSALKKNVMILHCTSEYPAPFEDVNLRAMDTLSSAFGLPVGLSDHTVGITVPLAAVALGARVIEKHFTLDKTMDGPDHPASLDPAELKAMVTGIRQIESALGRSRKSPAPSEIRNRGVARKSLIALKPIAKGQRFTEKNLTVKRPGFGIAPIHYWEWLGKPASRDFKVDEAIEP